MIVKLLKEEYLKSDQIYKDFCNNQITNDLEHYSNDFYTINDPQPFPIYVGSVNEDTREKIFKKSMQTIRDCYLSLNQDITLNQSFWHTLFLTEHRDYIIKTYPQVIKNRKNFENIILKKFDWENYIYKFYFGALYINDHVEAKMHERFFSLVSNNLDLYNYLLKQSVFRNSEFIINVLKIVDELNISDVLKARIRDIPGLAADERFGRRVLMEFNKEYPIVMFQPMSYEELKDLFLNHLKKYTEWNKENEVINTSNTQVSD